MESRIESAAFNPAIVLLIYYFSIAYLSLTDYVRVRPGLSGDRPVTISDSHNQSARYRCRCPASTDQHHG